MILAAGGATRLYPLTYTLPMVMVPVVNLPVIEHLLALLKRHGFDEVMVNLHYLHRLITDHLGDGSRFGIHLHYSHEEELSGTAGGVKRVAEFFDDTFLVLGGDDLTDLDLTAFLAYHREKGAEATLAAYPAAGEDEVGFLGLDEEGRIQRFAEKPKSKPDDCPWVNTGIYLFEPSIFDRIPEVRPFDFGRHLFPELVDGGCRFYGYPVEKSYWRDVEDPLNYRQAHWDVLGNTTGIQIPGQEGPPHIWVAEGGEISPQATVLPPVVVGEGARIEAGARVEGPVVLGAGVVVESGARVRSSVIWEESRLSQHCVVEDSLIGSCCLLQSHKTYSNILMPSGARYLRSGESQD